jgi:hypothetical protein
MNNEEEEKVIKVAIKVFMEHKQNNIESSNTEIVEQNKMNDCNNNDSNSNSRDTDQHVDKIRNNIDSDSSRNSIISSDINNDLHQPMDFSIVQSHSSSSREDPDVGIGNVIETNTVNDNDNHTHDTDQQNDKIVCDNSNVRDSDININSINLITNDNSCDITNDFQQSMDIEYNSNDGKDCNNDVDVYAGVGNAMKTIDRQAADSNVNNTLDTKVNDNVNSTAIIDYNSFFRCECGLRFQSSTFLFYHRQDQCKLWVGCTSSDDDDEEEEEEDINLGIKRSFKSSSNILPQRTQLARSVSGQ